MTLRVKSNQRQGWFTKWFIVCLQKDFGMPVSGVWDGMDPGIPGTTRRHLPPSDNQLPGYERRARKGGPI